MWDLLIITGGNDMEDLIQFQSGIETRQQARVQAVIGPPAVPEIPQITPSTWEEGMTLARAAINRHTNQTEARHYLWTEMPPSNYTDWRKWGQELVEQAKRCDWNNYAWEKAALDALIYQCPDSLWRQKILMEKWDFQTALDYGIRYVYAKAQSEGLGGAKKESTREEMPLDRVDGVKKEEVVMWDCWRCLRRHERGIATCTAMKKACAECDKTGHVKGSTYCSAYKKAEKAARNARSDRDRGRSDRGRGGGGNNSSWNSEVRGGKTKEIR